MNKVKIILHIGRHKTGTTAVQDYLNSNRDYLLKNGYCYLEAFIRKNAHHYLSESLSSQEFKALGQSEKKKWISQLRDQLLLSIDKQGSDKVFIISSEAFQNIKPDVIRELLPTKSFDVKVVAYFRETVGYAASSYNQRIHAKPFYIILDDYLKSFKPKYLQFADSWSEGFPNFRARLFDKDVLYNNNIVDDFLINELEIPKQDGTSLSSNPSLGRKYLSFKLEYNKRKDLLEEIRPGRLYSILAELSKQDERFYLTEEQKQRVLHNNLSDDLKFAKKYLGGLRFSYQESKEDQGLIDLDDENFLEIYNKILSLV